MLLLLKGEEGDELMEKCHASCDACRKCFELEGCPHEAGKGVGIMPIVFMAVTNLWSGYRYLQRR